MTPVQCVPLRISRMFPFSGTRTGVCTCLFWGGHGWAPEICCWPVGGLTLTMDSMNKADDLLDILLRRVCGILFSWLSISFYLLGWLPILQRVSGVSLVCCTMHRMIVRPQYGYILAVLIGLQPRNMLITANRCRFLCLSVVCTEYYWLTDSGYSCVWTDKGKLYDAVLCLWLLSILDSLYLTTWLCTPIPLCLCT